MEPKCKISNRPAIAFALAALAAAVPASAFAGEQAHTVRVPYGDLDLTSQAGVETLDRRLDRAVKRVCGQIDYRSNLDGSRVAACRRATRASIMPQRQFAIAKDARGAGKAWAENSARGQLTVPLSE